MVNLNKIYHFFKVPEGSNIFQGGGVKLFPGGGGGPIANSLKKPI